MSSREAILEARGTDCACSWCESCGPSSIVWVCLLDTERVRMLLVHLNHVCVLVMFKHNGMQSDVACFKQRGELTYSLSQCFFTSCSPA